MRILIATPQVGQAWGGIGTYVVELSTALAGSNSILIATAGSTPRMAGSLEVKAICPSGGVMASYARFQLALRRRLPHLIHEFHPEIILVNHAEMSDLLCHQNGGAAPLVVTAHTCLRTQLQSALGARVRRHALDCSEAIVAGLSPILLPAEMIYWKRIRHAIFVSRAIQRAILGAFRPNLSTSHLIPNGINVPRTTAGEVGAGGMPTDRDGARVLFVGRLLAAKGLGVLLNALGILPDLRWSCTVVGPGDSAPWILEARRLGIEARLRFMGPLPRTEVFRRMDASDIFVLPSFSESCPYTLLEAMGSSLPVVASQVGDIPEILDDGDAGLLFLPGDAHRLAQDLRMLMEDAGLRSSLGAKGRSRVVQHFSAEVMAKRTLGAFEEILSKNGTIGG